MNYQHNLHAKAPCSVLTHAVHSAFNKSYSFVTFVKKREIMESMKRIQDNETRLYKIKNKLWQQNILWLESLIFKYLCVIQFDLSCNGD